jgi:lysozyme family protein
MSLHDPIDTIIKHEGGYVNHPNDKGGPTKFGVTQDVYSEWLGRDATVEDVKSMTEEVARDIYESKYLTGPRIHLLPEPLQTQVLDIAVNSGPRTAVKMLQRVVNKAGFGPVDVDGVLGPNTRKVVETANAEMGPFLSNALVDERRAFFEAIVARNPSQKVFLKGWLNRAESFREQIEDNSGIA